MLVGPTLELLMDYLEYGDLMPAVEILDEVSTPLERPGMKLYAFVSCT